MRLLGGIFIVAATLSSCGPNDQATKAKVQPAQTPLTAGDLATAFASAGLKVENLNVLSAETDDNRLLGRPGQYTGKVFFFDARHPRGADPSEGENTIEVFASPEDAKARRDYIDGITKGVAMLAQYQILRGKVLVRFDKVLLPAEVEQYRKVIERLVPER